MAGGGAWLICCAVSSPATGAALTFASRQAIFGLDALRGLAGWGPPRLAEGMEALMLADPRHWQRHYQGTDLRVQRHFGLADRIRYYWPRPEAQAAVAAVLADLAGRDLPEPLLAQVFSAPVIRRAAELGGDPAPALIEVAVQLALDPYFLDTQAAARQEPVG